MSWASALSPYSSPATAAPIAASYSPLATASAPAPGGRPAPAPRVGQVRQQPASHLGLGVRMGGDGAHAASGGARRAPAARRRPGGRSPRRSPAGCRWPARPGWPEPRPRRSSPAGPARRRPGRPAARRSRQRDAGHGRQRRPVSRVEHPHGGVRERALGTEEGEDGHRTIIAGLLSWPRGAPAGRPGGPARRRPPAAPQATDPARPYRR